MSPSTDSRSMSTRPLPHAGTPGIRPRPSISKTAAARAGLVVDKLKQTRLSFPTRPPPLQLPDPRPAVDALNDTMGRLKHGTNADAGPSNLGTSTGGPSSGSPRRTRRNSTVKPLISPSTSRRGGPSTPSTPVKLGTPAQGNRPSDVNGDAAPPALKASPKGKGKSPAKPEKRVLPARIRRAAGGGAEGIRDLEEMIVDWLERWGKR